MKKYLFIIGLLLSVLTQATAQAPGVTVVIDNAKRHQVEREVAIRWNKFTPALYFMLLHNKYRKGPDKRNIKQLMPIIAATRSTADVSKKEEEEVTEIRDQEMFKMADRSLNKSYHLLYEKKFKNLNNNLALLNAQAIKAGVDFNTLLSLKGEQERINADIKITKEAYQDDSKKAEQFRAALADLTTLRGYYLRIINLYNTTNK